MSVIDVTRPSLPEFEEFCRELGDLWDSRRLTNMGAKHRALEQALREVLGVPGVALFANGHLALEAMIEAFGLHGEIVTTPFTFASTTHAIVRRGCVPVFCDIRPGDCTLDPEKLEDCVTQRTAAILPVHVYGRLCDTERIGAVAARHGLPVLYDAAHAFGVSRGGVSAAGFGDAAMFSFHATKVFHTLEGGAVCFSDPALAKRLEALRNFGLTGPEEVSSVGGNAKLNEVCAAMGLCNLRRLDRELAGRRAADRRYRQRLSGAEGLSLLPEQPGVTANGAYFPVFFREGRALRDRAQALLAERGINARKYFYPLTSACACYAGRPGFDPEATPVAKRAAESVLALPIYADLPPEEIDRICRLLLELV